MDSLSPEQCLECGDELVQEMVDIGVGQIPCEPRHCPSCGWEEDWGDDERIEEF
jgi:hypothetical protein